MRRAIAEQGGIEVGTEGDSFFAVFLGAAQALAAAEAAQLELAGGRVKVRMGIHTGVAEVADSDYIGSDVHLAARIAAAGHGGQVLLSSATASKLDAPDLTDLGEHRLKDFAGPVGIFQAGGTPFPPLRTISNTNLPKPASALVGREREVEEVVDSVRRGARFLTLTGSGGTGKTRLAIQAASELIPDFRAGVFWVGLSTVRDPALVLPTIGLTLGTEEEVGGHIGDREMLLLLDNLEQVADAGPDLATLVEQCPNLSVLVTSRELLRVRGEEEYAVPTLTESEAVALFSARSGAEADDDTARLCKALDNLPLALELAASRANVLTPGQILDRLSQRLDLFKAGRGADPRQETLRATIDWSYQLLSPVEQQLLASLSVFPSGCTLEGAEQVAEAALDVIASLVDKSLVCHGEDWFWMLDTIKQYAAERLESSGQKERMAERHALYYATVAEQMRSLLSGRAQDQWRRRAEGHMANVREALGYAIDHDSDMAMRIASGVDALWSLKGSRAEVLELLDAASALSDDRSSSRARVQADRTALRLSLGASPAEIQRDLDDTAHLVDETDDPWARYRVLEMRADIAAIERRIGGYLEYLRKALDALADTGVPWASRPRYAMAIEYADNGHLDQALEMADILEKGAREAGDRWGVERASYVRARVAFYRGDLEEAIAKAEGVVHWAESVGSLVDQLAPLTVLAFSASERSQRSETESLADRGDNILAELGYGGTFACYAVARAGARLRDDRLGEACEALRSAASHGAGELCQELRVMDLGAMILAELGRNKEAAALVAETDEYHRIAGTSRVPVWEGHVGPLRREDAIAAVEDLDQVETSHRRMFSALEEALGSERAQELAGT